MVVTGKERYAAGLDLGGSFVKLALISENGVIIFEDKLEIGFLSNSFLLFMLLYYNSSPKIATEMLTII